MERAVVRITLFGLLLALATTLPNKDDWDIYSFHINSTVSSRYATTVIKSRVANRMNESKEIEFQVRIPKNAFISKFRMFIEGQVYDGAVKGKESARQQYTEAVSRGESAGLVSSVGRTLEEFKTSVTVAAHKKVTFELTYEELLKRTLGKYELQIHARPMQPVKDFKVDVHINEKTGINFIEIKGGLSTKALANAITKTHADKQAWVYFYPTEDQQKTCDSCGEQGMNGDLVIVYDVNRDTSLGEIEKSDGYFVHHFAPSSLARIPKNVVFVIDRSGSMRGRKIEQTRVALLHILNDLAEEDHFGLITFDGNIYHWKRELVQANKENVESAKTFARNIVVLGATNINDAVLQGARMLNAHPREGSASILILLTDGDPNSGVTNVEVIHSNVRQAIADKFPLYCLGFGFDVKFEFLEKMSLQNNGVARRIYEDSDADLQLKGFYEEVATPLLIDVTMIYNGGTNLTQTNFSQFYNGSEIVVAGQITDNDIEIFTPQVVAISRSRKVTFSETNTTVESTRTVSNSHIQRVWAYLTVKQLLEKELLLSGAEKENVKKEILELSLKYNFVTPLTSMVVTKPPGEKTDVLHKPKEGETHSPPLSGGTWKQHYLVAHRPPMSGGPWAKHPPVAHSPPMSGGTWVHPPVAHSPPMSGGTWVHPPVAHSPPMSGGTWVHPPVAHSPPMSGGTWVHPPVAHSPPMSGGTWVHPHVAHSPPMRSGGFGGGGGGGGGFSRQNSDASIRNSPGVQDTSPVFVTTQMYFKNYLMPGILPFRPVTPSHAPHVDTSMKVHPTIVPDRTAKAPLSHRFLLKSENLTLPLCFDVAGDVRLKLLHHPTRELSVNGELDSVMNGGFKKIVIHLNTDLHVEVDTNEIIVRDGQMLTRRSGQDVFTAGSLAVIKRDKEIDVAVGDTRVVILIHVKDGEKFLWPVLREQPLEGNVTGILALKPAVYEELQQTPSIKLKIKDQEVDVTRANAVDYSIVSPPTLDCWLMPAESVLQRRLDDFIVTQL
ncbi:inter-alpha-trypsin inhibitor heavy chain H3-like [Centropristis striata]|uniref:inter-alpha-trypsin inhibitor heavy chain H3-like n=1 Tax=Centropristis striata TaxID=184440 RepID=UPI0027DF12F0|nr:inter-alpha-trypsin inhibitor heavy chain H3-like [Centropristis striata]